MKLSASNIATCTIAIARNLYSSGWPDWTTVSHAILFQSATASAREIGCTSSAHTRMSERRASVMINLPREPAESDSFATGVRTTTDRRAVDVRGRRRSFMGAGYDPAAVIEA